MKENRMPLVGAVPDGARLVAVLGGLPATDGVPLIGAESLIIPRLSAGDNALLGAEAASGFFPRKRDLERRATDLLDLVGLAVGPTTPVVELDVVDQRIVELARSLSRTPEFVLIDDRWTGFSADDSRRWYAAVARAAQVVPMVVAVDGLAGLEPLPLDAVVVVRGAEVVGAARPDESDRLLELLVGNDESPARPARVFGPVVLELRDVAVSHPIHHDRPVIEDSSLTVRAGEIVGLVGAESLVLGIFGASSGGRVSGLILLDGEPADLSTVERAIASRVLFISEHPPMYDVGLIGGIPTSVSGDKLARLARMGLIDSRKEYVARRAPSMLLEAIPGARSRPSRSGMNDVLAGWVENPPRVALVTEPFSGLSPQDRDIRRDLIEHLAAAGVAVVLEAAEAAQLVGLCDRFLVQRGTRLAAELAGEDATLRGLAALSIRFDVQR